LLFALLGLAVTNKSLARYNTNQVEANSLVSAFFSGSVGLGACQRQGSGDVGGARGNQVSSLAPSAQGLGWRSFHGS
jgi:hypothetical protein